MMAVGLCFLLFSFNDAEIKPKPVSVSLKLSILSKNLYSLCSEIFWKRKCLGNAQVKVLFQKEVQFTQRSFGKCLSSFSFENIFLFWIGHWKILLLWLKLAKISFLLLAFQFFFWGGGGTGV
jgi:hypothetical protein